jgi:sialic acid synthase SpsE
MEPLERLFTGGAGPVVIAAEIGINHNGNPEQAKRLIEAAKECGADAVKFQVYRTENFYNRALQPDGFRIFKEYELSYGDFRELKEFSERVGIGFFATPLDMDSLEFLHGLSVNAVKIASSDITTEPLLYRIRELGIPAILSTGFADLDTIGRAVSILDAKKTALLYCVSKYPAGKDDFDLNFIPVLYKKYGLPVGFSDHSLNNYFSIAAVALGARMIERHFTIDNNWTGADHAISLDQAKFSELVRAVREVEQAIGPGEKKITDFEQKIRGLSMRGMYAKRDIPSGSRLGKDDIALLRPGDGIPMEEYLSRIGKIVDKDIAENEKI